MVIIYLKVFILNLLICCLINWSLYLFERFNTYKSFFSFEDFKLKFSYSIIISTTYYLGLFVLLFMLLLLIITTLLNMLLYFTKQIYNTKSKYLNLFVKLFEASVQNTDEIKKI